MSQLALLGRRRFAGFYVTQFLGALNDNLFKNALAILVTYRAWSVWGLEPSEIVVLCGGLLILPFLLFSPLAGQLADRYPKHLLIRWVKGAEIVLMGLGAFGFWSGNVGLLLIVLFLMGTQSSFFGPAKYSILPQLLRHEELMAGNALVEMGTFLAILGGTIGGALLVAEARTGPVSIAAAVCLVAGAGYLAARTVPATPAEDPGLRIESHPIRSAREMLAIVRSNSLVWAAILGISWFWFLGSSVLSILPIFTKDVLRGGEYVVTLFLSLFCVGIALGSLLCGRLSGNKVEVGLAPLGLVGMTLVAGDLFWGGAPVVDVASTELRGVSEFVRDPQSWRIMFDFSALAFSSGFFVVPLYATMQSRSDGRERSRVIAANNIAGSLFMVASSTMLMLLLRLSFTLPEMFGVLALLNVVAGWVLYRKGGEIWVRCVAWCRSRGGGGGAVSLADLPASPGPLVLAARDLGSRDWFRVAAAVERLPLFVVAKRVGMTGLRRADIVELAAAVDPGEWRPGETDRIRRALESGRPVCVLGLRVDRAAWSSEFLVELAIRDVVRPSSIAAGCW